MPSIFSRCAHRLSVRLRRRQTNPDSDLGIEYGPRPSISSRGDAPSHHQHHHQQQPTLNRSYPCVYDGSQFTAMRSASFADGAFPDQDMDIPSSVTQTRSTAVVGPHTVTDQRTVQTAGISNGDVHFRGMSRSFHENGNVFGVTASKRNPSPVGRRASTDIPPPTYTAHRRSVQTSDGLISHYFGNVILSLVRNATVSNLISIFIKNT
ncbi:unnamed protein product [Anisakis simplex]|uniref:Uncharacterized protein n=1 Tax=Anisakis simplex TaxID=6269 RepID=A0A0M3K6T7_ANISI|nr:unnamed protein product [Anisakis simplex]